MNYDYLRQAGFPIGSGTVESGVNTVVHHRMKRQGSGWNGTMPVNVSRIERIA